MRQENISPRDMEEFLSRECGMKGMAGISDMRQLLERRNKDQRAREAVEIFCRQARKWIGAYAAAMGGLDTLVFSGGIGEHAPQVRAEICGDLRFLGIEIDQERKQKSERLITTDRSRVG